MSSNFPSYPSTAKPWNPPFFHYPYYPTVFPMQRSCPKCSKLIDITDKYCRHCGTNLQPTTNATSDKKEERKRKEGGEI